MKLEIGPAKSGRIYPDAITVDSVPRDGVVDYVATWGHDKLPFKDNTFDLVYASHVLEHVEWYKTQDALLEAKRVLKQGGELHVWVPDFAVILSCFLNEKIYESWTPHNEEGDYMKWVAGRLFAGTQENEESSWHRAVFDQRYLRRCFNRAGFVNVEHMASQPPEQRVNHDFINLGVRGSKP